MSGFCTIHNLAMQERESKTKFVVSYSPDGEEVKTPKTYFSHIWEGKMCFGESIRKSQANGRAYTPEIKPVVKEEEKVDWDAKDRQSMAQTAMKSASEIVAALISVQGQDWNGSMAEIDVKKMANEFFKELQKMKNTTEDISSKEEKTYP